MRYRAALRSLEELSEQAHLDNSNNMLTGNVVPASSSQASSLGTPKQQSPGGASARSPLMWPMARQTSQEESRPFSKSAPPKGHHVLRGDSQDEGSCDDLLDDVA